MPQRELDMFVTSGVSLPAYCQSQNKLSLYIQHALASLN
uniref:Uncharacterized protein n=1 Tax=Anguilla anguilla TaxID=7936 RepID=A0A0E9XWL7_ANGAN